MQKIEIPIPEQKEGKQKDIEASTEFETSHEAKQFFNRVKQRLLNVNQWGALCGAASAEFRLTDASGCKTERDPEVGFHIRINVPGPGTSAGDGYDWVEVEAVEHGKSLEPDTEFLIMRVRPSDNPTKVDREVAHFFSDKASSNFLIKRENKVVTAAVLGRNEIINTRKSNGLLNKLRNAVVGIGAALGMANPQWKSLVNGLLGK